jgi:cytochrome c-type biogenesis protein CcmE
VFEAKQVLAKHDEKYMPPDLEKALKAQGEWRGDGSTPDYAKQQPTVAEAGKPQT